MDSAKNQLADKIKTTNNVLISVSRNPSVDQLTAMLGLALAINKTGRHAAAVFSGKVPHALEFLQPEVTFEPNTDSLRDFIIALDKSKADKLRYKVEDDLVRIFITPYKTSLSDADLAFSQGDFNVDLVIALGVEHQEDLDEAITAHGRILHDATVSSITVQAGEQDQLGSINWSDVQASSLSEMVTELIQLIDPNLVDGQIATSLLTGIVSETERFSNDKTSAQTMSMSALLMAAGANQQLVASKLDEPEPEITQNLDNTNDDNIDDDSDDEDQSSQSDTNDEPPKPDDGTFEISHDDEPKPSDVAAPEDTEPAVIEETSEEPEAPVEESTPEPEETPTIEEFSLPQPSEPVDQPTPEEPVAAPIEAPEPEEAPATEQLSGGSRLVIQPPTMGGQLTANSQPETLDPSTDPMSVPGASDQLLSRSDPATTQPAPVVEEAQPTLDASLSALEAAVAPAIDQPTPEEPQAEVGDARDEVEKALSSEAANQPPTAIEALNAQPLGESLHPLEIPQPPEMQAPIEKGDGYTPVEDLIAQSAGEPQNPLAPPVFDQPVAGPQVIDPTAPPPVPPPMFNFGQPPAGPNPPQQQ